MLDLLEGRVSNVGLSSEELALLYTGLRQRGKRDALLLKDGPKMVERRRRLECACVLISGCPLSCSTTVGCALEPEIGKSYFSADCRDNAMDYLRGQDAFGGGTLLNGDRRPHH